MATEYRVITEWGEGWDGPWHQWIEHEQTVEFGRPPTEKEKAFPLLEIEGIPIRMRYEPVGAVRRAAT